jgi:undecaprenyl-phosphate 4-deoxy-4-formamido-L-arabinose transferase
MAPYISVVIPVYNEESNLENLYQRLTKVLDALGKPYEIIFTNDGSRDNSEAVLNTLYQRRPEEIRVIHFNGNYGQHMAIMAGLERVHGEIIVTLDADLQNPPEEIPKLIQAIEKGHDVVGGCRQKRQDSWWRLFVSKLHNNLRAWITPRIKMTDEGCMLRAYRRRVVDLMVMSGEASTFIPALAISYASNPTEIPVTHAPRNAGKSNYSFYGLVRYNFDLVTGFSLVPLQILTLIGMLISGLSTLFFTYTLVKHIITPGGAGDFTIFFAATYLLGGLILMGIGIVGEYIGRIYQEVRRRPRFVVREILEPTNARAAKEPKTKSQKNLANQIT